VAGSGAAVDGRATRGAIVSDFADRHRRIVDVVEPLERMGVEIVEPPERTDSDASGDQRTRDDDLCLTLSLRVPPALESIDDTVAERDDPQEARWERLRAQRDEARERAADALGWAEELEDRVTSLETPEEGSGSDSEADTDAQAEEPPADGHDQLTDGERETLQALRAMGDRRASREIADEVDGTLQSVRSWLTKLVQEGHIRAQPDPSDGRRKLYSPLDRDGQTDEASDRDRADEASDHERADEQFDGTVHIASHGGSPSQVFHVRADCPQLKKSADSVEKDRSVVPNHRPCANCVPDGLEEGLVAVASRSGTTTYHEREDCPKLGAANEVTVTEREHVPNYDPCDDCVTRSEQAKADDVEEDTGDGDEHDAENTDEEDGANDDDEDGANDADGSTAADICARNDLRREAVVEALDGATAIYHVQRELTLSSDETEALLRSLGVLENLDGGGRVTLQRAKSVTREHLPPANRLGSEGRDSRA